MWTAVFCALVGMLFITSFVLYIRNEFNTESVIVVYKNMLQVRDHIINSPNKFVSNPKSVVECLETDFLNIIRCDHDLNFEWMLHTNTELKSNINNSNNSNNSSSSRPTIQESSLNLHPKFKNKMLSRSVSGGAILVAPWREACSSTLGLYNVVLGIFYLPSVDKHVILVQHIKK